jgi:hypothetical protein
MEKLEKNEEVVLRKLKKHGLTENMQKFSMTKALHHTVLKRRRVKRRVVWEDYIVSTRITKEKWIHRLREKGIIEVDYKDRWRPKAKFTELGKRLTDGL